ncbi:hypothetical protein BN1050_00553 [Metalysinibacillus saudimassiliensis]|uniref:Uncharacterized protein n=1 Tax=Metalysinibacillus saudimassiliensis TaxID=1461583 RepID=A0A078M1Z4_9BACL|nr:hypothetical protein BN1050_00553 [Metalysinibacillus saudimassiliensis]
MTINFKENKNINVEQMYTKRHESMRISCLFLFEDY